MTITHGTLTGYSYWGCREACCRTARTQYELRHRRGETQRVDAAPYAELLRVVWRTMSLPKMSAEMGIGVATIQDIMWRRQYVTQLTAAKIEDWVRQQP